MHEKKGRGQGLHLHFRVIINPRFDDSLIREAISLELPRHLFGFLVFRNERLEQWRICMIGQYVGRPIIALANIETCPGEGDVMVSQRPRFLRDGFPECFLDTMYLTHACSIAYNVCVC